MTRRFLAGSVRLAKAEHAREKIEKAWEVELFASNLQVGAKTAAEAWKYIRSEQIAAGIAA